MELIRTTQDALSIAETFFQSGMFVDIKSSSQAMVKIMAGQEFGIPPFAAMSGIHLIKGKPTIGAGLMAQRVKKSGKYSYNVLQLTDSICELEFIQLPKTVLGISKFTVEDAKRAGTGEAGGMNLMGKFPKNMLFARAISNGVRWFTPDIYESVVYVPEEMQEVQQIEQPITPHEVILTEADVSGICNGCITIEELKTVFNSNTQFANFKPIFATRKKEINAEISKD